MKDGWINAEFIEVKREKQPFKTLKRQKEKFNRLLNRQQVREGNCTRLHGVHIGKHSIFTRQNNTSCAQDKRRENPWVRNLSNTPLTQDQTKALAHGPNFAIVPEVHQ